MDPPKSFLWTCPVSARTKIVVYIFLFKNLSYTARFLKKKKCFHIFPRGHITITQMYYHGRRCSLRHRIPRRQCSAFSPPCPNSSTLSTASALCRAQSMHTCIRTVLLIKFLYLFLSPVNCFHVVFCYFLKYVLVLKGETIINKCVLCVDRDECSKIVIFSIKNINVLLQKCTSINCKRYKHSK